ncbi:hypothetical protein ACA910_003259 [Epithemia clementina (nom. ined.)]
MENLARQFAEVTSQIVKTSKTLGTAAKRKIIKKKKKKRGPGLVREDAQRPMLVELSDRPPTDIKEPSDSDDSDSDDSDSDDDEVDKEIDRNKVDDKSDDESDDNQVPNEREVNQVDETIDDKQIDDNNGRSEFNLEDLDFSDDNDLSKETLHCGSRSPFDVKLLGQSIAESSKILSHLDDKEVVLVVGKTGTGKTTLMQAIAGKKMYATQLPSKSNSGEAMNKTVFEAENGVEGFVIGHKKASETKHCNFYKETMSVKRAGSTEMESKDFFFLDSPGFQDTDGPELDIATSVVLSQVAKRARSLRFVILIRYISLLEDRGGAVKDILKLVRAFVQDFEQSRLAFVFLFTHTNEIARNEQKYTLEAARKGLLDEVITTMDGTKDAELWQVLNYMAKCLERNYRMVDVFHPVLSNVAALKSTIQKLQAVSGDHLAAHCGLTPTSKLKLTGELNKMAQDVRSALESDSPDLDRVCDVLRTFRHLKANVPVQEVQVMANRVCDIIRAFMARQHKHIQDLLELGTSWNREFGPANATSFRLATQYLKKLKDDFPNEVDLESVNRQLVDGLKVFCDKLKVESQTDLSKTHYHLNKLRAWSDGLRKEFPGVVEYYTTSVGYVSNLVESAVAQVNKFNKASQLEEAESQLWINDVIIGLHALESVVAFADALTLHFDVSQAQSVSSRAKENLLNAMDSYLEVLREYDMKNAVDQRQDMNFLVSQAKAVEKVYSCLKDSTAFPGLQEKTRTTRQRILEAAATFVDSGCAKVQSMDFAHVEQVEPWVRFLYKTSQSYLEVGTQAWSDILAPYRSVVDDLKHWLKTKSGELTMLTKMAKNQGVKDGRRDSEALKCFISYKFFDELLPSQDRFVANSLVAYAAEYKNRAAKVIELAEKCTLELTSRTGDQCELLCSLEPLLQEQAELNHLGHVLYHSTYIDAQEETKAKLKEYIQIFAARTKATCSAWLTACREGNEEEVTLHTKELCIALQEVDLLISILNARGLDLHCDPLLESIRGEITNVTREFADEAESLVGSDQEYEGKLKCLRALAVVFGASNGNADFVSLDFDKLKEEVRHGVRRHADSIEALILETTNCELVDLHLSDLERAKMLDEFTSSEGSMRIRSLRALLEQKRSNVDSIVQELLDTHNYKGLREFLAPSAASTDPMKKQYFDIVLARITTSLSVIAEDIDRRLTFTFPTDENLRVVAQGIKAIHAANAELEDYLEAADGGSSLNDKVKLTEKTLNAKTLEFVSKINQAANSNDFVALGTNQVFVKVYEGQLKDSFTTNTERALDEAAGEFRKAVDSLEPAIKEFSSSWFKSQTLLPVLASLKAASEHKAPSLPELAAVYSGAKGLLTRTLEETMITLKGHVSQQHCFDDAIRVLSDLDKLLKIGLKVHIESSTLLEDISHHLTLWEDARAETDRNHFHQKTSETMIIAWKKELKALDPSTWRGAGNFFATGDENSLAFRDYCGKVAARVREDVASGETAIQNRDYQSARGTIVLLEIMEDNLAGYIPTLLGASKRLTASATAVFRDVCSQMKESLLSESRREFQGIYENYRQIAVALPSVVVAVDEGREFKLSNQLVYETLLKDIDQLGDWKSTFDVQLLKKRIERLRAFGSFVADYATLLHEEVRVSELGQDEWLSKTVQLCQQHFHSGRDFGRVHLFAQLSLPPSAIKQEVEKAYSVKATNPLCDKQGAIAHARDELIAAVPDTKLRDQSFDDFIRNIHSEIRKDVKNFLSEQRYDEVESILFRLGELHLLDDLVSPPLQSTQTSNDIMQIVKHHVDHVKNEINSNWAQRKYQSLNENISQLKLMESKLNSYPEILSASWNLGVFKEIEEEIIHLRDKAQNLLSNPANARNNTQDFRRYFIDMGKVMVELPLLKEFTKSRMNEVLESCLAHDWGHSYLFDIGLGLQRHDDSSTEEENLVAQMILTEFSHFKEVLTMVWNEETSQKPVEETVDGIRGVLRYQGSERQADIDSELLLKGFQDFEGEYKYILGDFLQPDADLTVLVKNVAAMSDFLKPCSCDMGWLGTTKQKIPYILAGVFAVFTILKSGESYKRVGSSELNGVADKILMKPHNIQVLTLLCMFGCGSSKTDTLESQLMQIRTGEGKSMILGAAALVLGLLGFRVRCVCYSKYLSDRDYNLFKEVFEAFHLTELVKYSMITALSEDTTARKGNIRHLTERLLRGRLNSDEASRLLQQYPSSAPKMEDVEEILLVDEVDVFFGPEFYGQTYNQVALVQDPAIETILRQIWEVHKTGGKRLRLGAIQTSEAYQTLLRKFSGFEFLLDSEISAMLNAVRLVDEEPYYVDKASGRIGYKVMDTVSFEATYGYRTVFAHIKEAENGNIAAKEAAKHIGMQVSCGRFSYANISPSRVLGVSGTLEAMGNYEKDVLAKYGLHKFLGIPSVYGQSNFSFDKAGKGIRVEKGKSDYFHSITDQIQEERKQKRAIIVFFPNKERLDEYTNSAFYRKLGRRNLALLKEDMTTAEKDFVISKAATSGQVTLTSAVFGRGTDFFCKDDRVQQAGGVHIIQAFLSEDISEEIQIQGRTARQGKKGTYQMIVLESDLTKLFGVGEGAAGNVANEGLYSFLAEARQKCRDQHCLAMEQNLLAATDTDMRTHSLFNALLKGDSKLAFDLFRDLYSSFKNKQMPSAIDVDICFAVDQTGSMAPFNKSARDTLKAIVHGENSVTKKLQAEYPTVSFTTRFAVVGYRDVDDKTDQFCENIWNNGSHFTDDSRQVVKAIDQTLSNPFGGGDIAEDHLGAIQRCCQWKFPSDWTSQVRFLLLLTDAPAHGLVPQVFAGTPNADDYGALHPKGVTLKDVSKNLIDRDIDIFFGSFNPQATIATESELAKQLLSHPDNTAQREILAIPLVDPTKQGTRNALTHAYGKHIVFVLDESGSMSEDWSGVVKAYNEYLGKRKQNQCVSDLVSVVQFEMEVRTTVKLSDLSKAPADLPYRGGGTCFNPAAQEAQRLVNATPSTHVPVVVFMSDGDANDADAREAALTFSRLNRSVKATYGGDLELHVIAFGYGANTSQLQAISKASTCGKIYTSDNTAALSDIFVSIAGGTDVAQVIQAEVAKRISEAVADRLAIEYRG